QLVAVCRSGKAGAGTLRVYESASGRELPDSLPCPATPMRDGSIVWAPDNSGIYYTRSQAPGAAESAGGRFHQQVYFHKLGAAPEEDRYEIGREFPRLAEIQLKSGGEEGRYLIATVANGDGGDRAHWLRDPSGRWRQVARFEDRVQQIEFGHEPVYIEW